MITPDEIKKALEICASDTCCDKCPYVEIHTAACLNDLASDSLEYIQHLEAQISELTENGKYGGCV